MNEEYTYEQYLETWKDQFGDAEEGEFRYWFHGVEWKKTLPKMGEEQFKQTLARFDKLSPQIDELQRRPDYAINDEIGARVDRLLAESFKCELPLFF